MAKPKKDKGVLAYRLILTFIIVLAVGGFAIAYWSQQRPINAPVADNGKVMALAECLAGKGVKMYGTYWCPHCQDQKKEFGAAFEKINYIECADPANERAPQMKACEDAGIKGYPTWMWPDASVLEGPQPFKALAEKSGCPWVEEPTAKKF